MDNENNNIEEMNPALEEQNSANITNDSDDNQIVQSELMTDDIFEPEPIVIFEDSEVTEVIDNSQQSFDIKPQKSNKRIIQGEVVSSKPDKTIVIKIVRQVAHPLYKKYYKRSKKIMAHDENNECNVGDKVRVIESRPLSKVKRWRLVEIIERAK